MKRRNKELLPGESARIPQKKRTVRGTFPEQKERARKRQAFFDSVKTAKLELDAGNETELHVGKARIRTSVQETMLAVIRMRRGYALIAFGGKNDDVHGLVGAPDLIAPMGFAFQKDRLVFWCTHVPTPGIPSIGHI